VKQRSTVQPRPGRGNLLRRLRDRKPREPFAIDHETGRALGLAHQDSADVPGDHAPQDLGLAVETCFPRPEPGDRTREPPELGDQGFGLRDGRTFAFIPDE
jgi:hypothetical protein